LEKIQYFFGVKNLSKSKWLADKNIFFEMVAPSHKNKNGLVRGWLEAKRWFISPKEEFFGMGLVSQDFFFVLMHLMQGFEPKQLLKNR
jgi:hypothetical protein